MVLLQRYLVIATKALSAPTIMAITLILSQKISSLSFNYLFKKITAPHSLLFYVSQCTTRWPYITPMSFCAIGFVHFASEINGLMG